MASSSLGRMPLVVHIGRPVQRHHEVLAGKAKLVQNAARAGDPCWRAACRSSCCRRRRSRSSLDARARRFSFASALVVKNQLVIASVTIRLISSGIDQSPERMPASTCATGTAPVLRALIAHAMVDVTSPTTRQQVAWRGRAAALVADHDARRLLGLRAGTDLEVDVRLGNAELRKKSPDMLAS